LSNGVFRAVFATALGILVLFVALFLGAAFVYAGPARLLEVLARPEAMHSIWLSIATSSAATLFAFVFAVPAAYALTRWRIPGRGFIDMLLDLPIVLPPLVAGFCLLLFYAVLDRTLTGTLAGSPLDLRFTQHGIVLAQFTIAAPLAVRVLRAAFAEVPPRLETMSRSLGSGEARTFLRVSLPMSRNGIIAGIIMVWARSIAEFGPILVFSGAVRDKTDVLPIAIFLAFSNGELENGVALSALLIVLGALAIAGIRRIGGESIRIA
jgi:molybdate transport system permease protein